MRRCTVCSHRQRAAIDTAIIEGYSFRAIAKQFKTSHSAVGRHASHVSLELAKSAKAARIADANSIAQHLQELIADANNLRQQARRQRDRRGVLGCIRELSRLLLVLTKVVPHVQKPDPFKEYLRGLSDEELENFQVEKICQLLARDSVRVKVMQFLIERQNRLRSPEPQQLN